MSSSTFSRRVSDATMPPSPTYGPLTRVSVPAHLMQYAPGPLALMAHTGGVPVPVSASAWADALALVNAASAGPSSADALDAHAWWLTLVSAAENGVGPRDTTVNFNNKPWSGAEDVFNNTITEVSSSSSRRRDFDAHNGLASPTYASASTQTMHIAPTQPAFQHQHQPRRQTSHDNVGASAATTSSSPAAKTATATANRRHSAEPDLPSPVVPTFAMHSMTAVAAGPAPMRGPTEAFNALVAGIPSMPASDDEDELSGDEPSDQIITPARQRVAPAPSATNDDTDAAIADILDELDLHRDLIAESAAQLERLHPRANARDANKRRQYLSLPLLEVLNDSGVAPPSSLAPLRSRTDISLLSRGELAEWVAYYNGFCPPTSVEGMQRALCACVGVKYDFGGAGCIEDADGGWKEPSPEEAAASEAAAIARAQEEQELYGGDYDEYDYDYDYESEEPERMPWDDEDDDYEPPHIHFEYDPSWPTVLLGEEPSFSSDVDDGGWGKTVTLDLYADEVIRTPDEMSGSAKTGAAALDHASKSLQATADDSDTEWVDASDGAAFLVY